LVAQSRKNIPPMVETQFLRDLRVITDKVAELIVNDARGRSGSERTLAALLQLALSMESSFAVWCWRHVHLERVSPYPGARGSLRKRAEEAMRDADRIAERLHQITGTAEFRVDWPPSASEPLVVEQWTFGRAVQDEIAADRIALACYTQLLDYVRENDAPTASVLEAIARSRKRRLRAENGRAATPRSA
jgi:bacterioferritin (cytochrome b1)